MVSALHCFFWHTRFYQLGFSHGDLQLVLDFIAFHLARFHGHV